MSSSYVRTLLEGWLNDGSMAVPYYPTINEEQNPQDDIWCTARFSSDYRDKITYCQGDSLEEGEAEIFYYGRAGIGYNDLLAALETDMMVLMAQRDTLGKCVLVRRSAPFETSGGSAEHLYGLSVYVDYQFYE